MNRSEVIGYWARVNGLTWADVFDLAGELFPDGDGDIYYDFCLGYQDAEMELLRQKVEQLKCDLYAADPDEFSDLELEVR